VRRAFLCGRDAYSGRDYEHRRAWIRERLRELAGLFAVEVEAYAVMSNHVHVVVRTSPGRARAWGDAEVALRWLALFSGIRGGSGGRPGEAEVAAFCRDRPKLETCRRRLADLSWFMRCLNEPIARRANREDECTGRFWEGRFKCQRLDDEGAALACMVYVDLNPVRAGMAGTPESSDFTSAQDRCVAYRARLRLRRALPDLTPQQAALVKRSEADATRDVWLAPIGTRDGDGDDRGGASETSGATLRPPVHTGAKDQAPSLLAHLREEDYLELLDWTGREIRAEKRGHISP
jgi:REP element-mobilizing transposase RayT